MTNAPQKPSLQFKDLKDIASLSGVSLSFESRLLAYVRSFVVSDKDDYADEIIIIDVDTQQQVTSWQGSVPQWSPTSNQLAYLDAHEDATYIWLYDADSNSHRPLAPVYESHYFMGHLALKNFAWSPNGLFIAYISADGEPQALDESVFVTEGMLYKTKGGRVRPTYADDKYSHVWIADVNTGATQLLTDGSYNEHSICWSPESDQIAFVSNRTEDPDNNQLYDLYSVDVNTKTTTRYTTEFGTVHQPAWSPDGALIAFLGTTSRLNTNDSPAEDTHVYTLHLQSGSIKKVSASLDRRAEQVRWHPRGEKIYFTAGDKGTTAIYQAHADGNLLEKLVGDQCQVLEYVIGNDGDSVYYVSMTIDQLTDIFRYNPASGSILRLTNNNNRFTQNIGLQTADTFWFKTFDDVQVQGWLMKPSGFQADQKYPLVLVIHGGPHNMFGYGFEDRMQLLAASGYGVLYINPRGSHGYGQAFSRGCVMAWGEGDYLDLMAGVDAALQNNKWIDADRLGVTGQSYGGYMSNRIITKTNRFKAAVVDGGLSNLISFAGTSLYHSLMESEFDGSAYDNFSILWKCSPLKDVKNVTTPTLILHGERDYEVPAAQGEEMYIALKKLGVQTKLVLYKGEGHGWRPDLKPANRLDLFKRMIEWFDNYLRPAGKPLRN